MYYMKIRLLTKCIWALGAFLLCIITLKIYTFLDCDLEDHQQYYEFSLDRSCRKSLYAPLEISAKNQISCSTTIQGDVEAVEEARIDRLLVKNKEASITDEGYLNITIDCEMYKKIRKFITFCQSKEEEDFPIAYSMVIHEKIYMFERLLRAIYTPQNIYCVHVDEKSPDLFKRAVRAITSCFDNVFVASKLEKVVYASWSRVQADLNCMEDLLKSDVQWRYLLNTCGTDFPIKTNAEMVRALKALNGKNSMESEETPIDKKQRWQLQYKVDKYIFRTKIKKSPPPDNIPMFSGSAYIVITRDFVKSLFENPVVMKLIEWEKDTYSPDEHMWATLNRISGVPGSVPSHRKYDRSDLTAIARLVKWQEHAGDVSKGAPYAHCTGAYRRSVCVYGIGDLPWILQQHHLFANKFDSNVDNNVIQCLEQYLRHKTLYGTDL